MQIGDKFTSTRCGDFTIVKYVNCNEVYCQFEDTGFVAVATAGSIRKGFVKDLLFKLVFDIGYIGGTSFTHKSHPKEHQLWRNMFARCYSDAYHKNNPSYIGCSVDERWHNFQTFCSDLPTLPGYREWKSGLDFQLDKDMIIKSNRKYSPETCMFVSRSENLLEALTRRYS